MRRSPQMNLLLLALGAMFFQQTFAALGRNLPPIIAPAILQDLQLDPAWIGVYVGLTAAAALVAQLGCGSFILRYGALRTSQAALALVAVGLALATAGPMALFALSAIIGGGGSAVSTPASSHLLGRYSPPRYAPLVFSLKQTAVPAGLLLAGLLGPLLVAVWGWRAAMLAAAAACLVFAFLLQPTRREFDSDRLPSRSFHMSDFGTTLKVVTRGGELRNLSFACFAFNGLQMVFVAYFVTYLVVLGHDLAVAGMVFSIATLVAVPGRVFWGWFSSARASPRLVLAWLSIGMAASTAMIGLAGSLASLPLLGLSAVVLSATVLSWHGVLLAEAARLAPEGMRGAATGGVLSFGQLGALTMPLFYAAVLSLSDSHALAFILSGLPCLVVGLAMLARGTAPRPPQST